jgi:hypothetical protein
MTLLRSTLAAAAVLAFVLPASAKDAGGSAANGPTVQGAGYAEQSQGGAATPARGSGGSAGGQVPQEYTQAPTYAPCGPVAAEAVVAISNEGAGDIWYVQMSPVEDQNYGADLLGETEVIQSGYYTVVTPDNPTGACRFDVLITYASGAELAIWDVDICSYNVIYATEREYEIGYDQTI